MVPVGWKDTRVQQIAGPPAPETLRADQLARRQRIVRAALKALAGSDYEQVKISDVARDSGVALGTLYRYFASKEHLFAAVFVEWQGALKKKLERERPQGETEAERLRDVFHRTIRAFQLQPQFYRVVMVLTATTDPYATEALPDAGGPVARHRGDGLRRAVRRRPGGDPGHAQRGP